MKLLFILGTLVTITRALAASGLKYEAALHVDFQEETFSCRQDFMGTKPFRITLSGGVLKGVPKPLHPLHALSSKYTFPTLQRCFRAALVLNDQLAGTHDHFPFTVPVGLETYEEDKPGHTHSTTMHEYTAQYEVRVAGTRFTSYGRCTAQNYLSKRECLQE